MEKKIEILKGFRTFLLHQIDGLSANQLNYIPVGYNNNIIWNIGHMNAAMQNMIYVKAGLPITISGEYFNAYLPGTAPDAFVSESSTAIIKELFIRSLDQLQEDLGQNIFKTYSPSAAIPKVYGFEVNNIDAALEYILYHDGLHAGYINALRKLV